MIVRCHRCLGGLLDVRKLWHLIESGWVVVLIRESARGSRLVAYCYGCRDKF